MRGLSPAVASGGHSSSWCAGLSLSRPLPLRSTGSRRAGSVVVAHGLSCSAACGILPDQGSTRVPCIGRQTPNHCATREAFKCVFQWLFLPRHTELFFLTYSGLVVTLELSLFHWQHVKRCNIKLRTEWKKKETKGKKRIDCIKDCIGCAKNVRMIATGVYYSLPTGTL